LFKQLYRCGCYINIAGRKPVSAIQRLGPCSAVGALFHEQSLDSTSSTFFRTVPVDFQQFLGGLRGNNQRTGGLSTGRLGALLENILETYS
jgi:hypothetical protein